MDQINWTYKTSNFTVECQEFFTDYIDELIHPPRVVDAIMRGDLFLTNLKAQVCWRGINVGNATLSNCIQEGNPMFPDWPNYPDDPPELKWDRSYRYTVIRGAIRDARQQLTELQDDIPDLRLRRM